MMTRLKGPLLALLCLLSDRALAWNDYGHMTVAAVAYDRLTPQVQQKASALLKLNPKYQTWVAAAQGQNADKVAFMMAATWPDAIKSDPKYKNDGDRPSGPDVARNTGYDDLLQHRYWHFIDTPFSPDGTAVAQPVPPNAETQIIAFRATLSSASASDALKSYDLVWLLHLVGDVHQPLHATSRFTKDLPHGDSGANLVALCAKPCRDELHAFWDDVLGTSKSPAAIIRAAAKLSPASDADAANLDERQWIAESFQDAKDTVYSSPIGKGKGPFTLDAAYKAKAKALASARVELAGARLANVLNEALR
jgi:hypothetical protein